jgi:hypothetical protein
MILHTLLFANRQSVKATTSMNALDSVHLLNNIAEFLAYQTAQPNILLTALGCINALP